MQKVTISGTDISKFAILLPSEPDPAEVTAAEYLQMVLQKTAGVKLEITSAPKAHNIRLGEGSTEGIKFDGFTISADETDLYLRGRIPRGSLYAAYDFTERFLGVRHFAPDCKVYPTQGNVEIPAGYSLTDNPVFDHRQSDSISVYFSPEHTAYSRVNIHSTPEYGGNTTRAARGHTFVYQCPPEKYFAEHPEYYSLWNGKRIPAGPTDGENEGQLCLTNPEVLKIVTESVLKTLRANPGLGAIAVTQNDNQHYCQCENCARVDAEEGSHAGSLIRFVNAVAEAVEKEFPDVLVATYAYQYTRTPPKLTRPRKNVLINYCTIEACFSHPMNDEHCYKNGPLFARELADWGKIATQMSIRDYTANYHDLIGPYPNMHVIRPNMKFFAESNAIGVFEEDCRFCYCGGLGELRAYLINKLMWNPYMSEEEFEAIKHEFMAAYFGPGWPSICKAMDIESEAVSHHEMYCFDGPIDGYDFYEAWPKADEVLDVIYNKKYRPTFTDGLIPHCDELIALWDDAAAKAETEAQRRHVRRGQLSAEHLKLFYPRKRESMTDAERVEYEAAVETHIAAAIELGMEPNVQNCIKKFLTKNSTLDHCPIDGE